MLIFHIAEPDVWNAASANGLYTGSTRGASLDDVGFIHCSFQHQVETVANFLYADCDGLLLLLEADADLIPAEIRVENLDGGTEEFPHIYGPLPVAAVKRVHELVRKPSGWQLPSDL